MNFQLDFLVFIFEKRYEKYFKTLDLSFLLQNWLFGILILTHTINKYKWLILGGTLENSMKYILSVYSFNRRGGPRKFSKSCILQHCPCSGFLYRLLYKHFHIKTAKSVLKSNCKNILYFADKETKWNSIKLLPDFLSVNIL